MRVPCGEECQAAVTACPKALGTLGDLEKVHCGQSVEGRWRVQRDEEGEVGKDQIMRTPKEILECFKQMRTWSDLCV